MRRQREGSTESTALFSGGALGFRVPGYFLPRRTWHKAHEHDPHARTHAHTHTHTHKARTVLFGGADRPAGSLRCLSGFIAVWREDAALHCLMKTTQARQASGAHSLVGGFAFEALLADVGAGRVERVVLGGRLGVARRRRWLEVPRVPVVPPNQLASQLCT